MRNESLYKAIEEKAFELGNESMIVKYETKGNSQHAINITWDEVIEHEDSNIVFKQSK